MSVSSKPRSQPRTYALRKTAKTSSELEEIIASRFGCPAVQVAVKGVPPDWNAVLIGARAANAELIASFKLLVSELRREFALRA